jgi:hypothetical protein
MIKLKILASLAIIMLLIICINAQQQLSAPRFCSPYIKNIGKLMIFKAVLIFNQLNFAIELNELPKLPGEFQSLVELTMPNQTSTVNMLLLYDKFDKRAELTTNVNENGETTTRRSL